MRGESLPEPSAADCPQKRQGHCPGAWSIRLSGVALAGECAWKRLDMTEVAGSPAAKALYDEAVNTRRPSLG